MSQKGMGLIQFRENKTEIEELRNKGHGKRMIYEHLKEHLTISYVQFTRIWNREFDDGDISPPNRKGTTPALRKTVTSQPTTPPPQQDIFRRNGKTLHNPSMTDERKKDLFGT